MNIQKNYKNYNNYPLVSNKIEIKREILSSYQQKVADFNYIDERGGGD